MVKNTKDVEWEVEGKTFKVKNVPYSELPAEENIYFDTDVSLRLIMIRELMHKKEIPTEVDYATVADFEV